MNAYAILTSGCEGVNLHFHPPNLSRIVGVGQDVILVPFCYRCLHQYVHHRFSIQGTARLLYNSFGSSMWMMPFSKYCRTDNIYWKHFDGGSRKSHHTYQCDAREYQLNFSGWPTNVVNVEIPSKRGETSTRCVLATLVLSCLYGSFCCLTLSGVDAYPSIFEVAQANMSIMECGLPTQLSFSAREVSDGTFFKAIEDYDPESKRFLHQLFK